MLVFGCSLSFHLKFNLDLKPRLENKTENRKGKKEKGILLLGHIRAGRPIYSLETLIERPSSSSGA
jgi:hypothetical protein